MRERMYVTMMDPFQIKYGNLLSGALVLPSIMTDVLWVAATLLGLGEHASRWSEAGERDAQTRNAPLCSPGVTVSVILDLPFAYCVWLSSAVAIVYTLLGGLYSVAYTDVIQLALTFFSLVSVSGLLPRAQARPPLAPPR